MSSYLDYEGIWDNKRTFAVTNWSEEDFTVTWKEDTGDAHYTLHAGEVNTYPMYLAYYITRNFVDREMYREAAKIAKNPDGSPSRQQERLEMAVNNKELRKPYEDKTMQEVIAGQESPEVTAMRAQIRKQLIIEQGMHSEMHNNQDGSQKEISTEEFADVPKKVGRPKKVVA